LEKLYEYEANANQDDLENLLDEKESDTRFIQFLHTYKIGTLVPTKHHTKNNQIIKEIDIELSRDFTDEFAAILREKERHNNSTKP
jgi:hypothetical protein